ncbi:MAG: hypothetical protein ACI9O1_000067, partial [Candidatus Thalassarchaeaceae archaeon]
MKCVLNVVEYMKDASAMEIVQAMREQWVSMT